MGIDQLLEALLYRLALGPPEPREISNPNYVDAIEYLERTLDLRRERLRRARVEMRMRLALHLAPREAVNFDPTGGHTREELILEYLIGAYQYPRREARALARDVANA